MANQEVNDLFRELRSTADPKIAQQLRARILGHVSDTVQHHSETIANRLPSKQYMDAGDLSQEGYAAAIEVMDRFNPDRKLAFQTFARLRIRGAMLDSMREVDVMSRTGRVLHRVFEQITKEFHATHGYKPLVSEVIAEARRRGVPKKALKNRYILSQALDPKHVLSGDMQRPFNGGVRSLFEDAIAPNQSTYDYDATGRVKKLTAGMGEMDRFIFINHFYKGVGQGEIADVIGLSKGRISQRIQAMAAQIGQCPDKVEILKECAADFSFTDF